MMDGMREDVAPAGPRDADDRCPGPHSGQAPDVWNRWVVGWQVAFWLMIVLASFQLVVPGDPSAERRVVALVALAALAAAYGPARHGPDRTSKAAAYTYLGVATVVVGITCWLNPGLAILLFIVYPQIWVYSETLRTGIAFSAAVTVSSGAGFLAAAGWSGHALWEIAPSMAVSLLFSLLLGIWISRIIDQSHDRGTLIAQLETTRSELAAAHHAQGVMAERERLAREIHDTLAQGFTSIVMLSQVAADGLDRDTAAARRQLETIEAVARENLAEARALVAAFSPVSLVGATLSDAVGRLAERFGAETGLAVDVEALGDFGGLAREQEVVVLRVAQEALTNVRRHARARQVTVRLVADEDGARVEVGDDGVGFSPATGQGYGLAGMRGRVREVGGDLDVASAPGRGTRVTVRVPLRPPLPPAATAAAAAPAGGTA
jgi:signal transduction histidine kinase